MTLGLIGIAVSLILLIVLAYRGHSVLVVAPVAALVAALFSGAPLLGTYTQIFMPALAGFLSTFFPLFLTGAILGKLMTDSGYAEDLASWISDRLGPKHALLVTVLSTALLTYGGISAWVIVFTMFPVATFLFRQADIPRRLMPAAIALGIFTFATAALPGSPQIHNAIPTRFFGTNTFAAPGLALVCAVIVFGLGMWWLAVRQRQLAAAGESYTDLTEIERRDADAGRPSSSDAVTPLTADDSRATRRVSTAQGLIGLLPILVVVGVNALLTYVVIPAMDTAYLSEEKYGGVTVEQVASIWSVAVAMLAAIVVIFLLRPRRARTYVEGLSQGAKNSVLPVFTTASEVAYGAVIAALAAFALIRDGIFDVSDNPIVTTALSTAGIAGVTGSASGGLTISLNTFGEQLLSQANALGIDPEVLHRVAAMASISFDSMPHNGAIITLLLVTGLTHRESYKDIFVVTVLVPLVGLVAAVGLGMAFGSF
ncbi:GntP family permease [Kytococcus sedentarius]|uniref:GntP family permease n=1 Tax=Kytococcus sedentarius TaxID=1276 RepID=UPI0035BBBE73